MKLLQLITMLLVSISISISAHGGDPIVDSDVDITDKDREKAQEQLRQEDAAREKHNQKSIEEARQQGYMIPDQHQFSKEYKNADQEKRDEVNEKVQEQRELKERSQTGQLSEEEKTELGIDENAPAREILRQEIEPSKSNINTKEHENKLIEKRAREIAIKREKAESIAREKAEKAESIAKAKAEAEAARIAAEKAYNEQMAREEAERQALERARQEAEAAARARKQQEAERRAQEAESLDWDSDHDSDWGDGMRDFLESDGFNDS